MYNIKAAFKDMQQDLAPLARSECTGKRSKSSRHCVHLWLGRRCAWGCTDLASVYAGSLASATPGLALSIICALLQAASSMR